MSKADLKIDWATYAAAKYACENWHYSKCLPSSMQKRVAIGAWERDDFKGVVVFGHGANPSIGNPYGLTINECIELTRVALRNHENQVSRIIRIALNMLIRSQPKIRLIVSYADTGQNHHGGIYQAGNWVYSGISKGVPTLYFNGRKWHAKALRTSYPKLKHNDPRITKIKGTDKHKYLMPLDKEMAEQIRPLAKPYPKKNTRSKHSHDAAGPPAEGGLKPT